MIARLNQRDIRNQLTQARAQFDNAKAELDRAERLISENAIARFRVGTASNPIPMSQKPLMMWRRSAWMTPFYGRRFLAS